jgi:hypothetical protein
MFRWSGEEGAGRRGWWWNRRGASADDDACRFDAWLLRRCQSCEEPGTSPVPSGERLGPRLAFDDCTLTRSRPAEGGTHGLAPLPRAPFRHLSGTVVCKGVTLGPKRVPWLRNGWHLAGQHPIWHFPGARVCRLHMDRDAFSLPGNSWNGVRSARLPTTMPRGVQHGTSPRACSDLLVVLRRPG